MSTYLMLKLFSESTPEEVKEVISDKIEEARTEGSADTDEYSFSKVDDDTIVIEDKGNNEVTIAESDEDGSIKLTAADEDIDDDDHKDFSDSLQDVDVDVEDGIDGDHLQNTAPNVEIKVEEGIGDKEKAGVKSKTFSITISNATPDIIRATVRSFADAGVIVSEDTKALDDPKKTTLKVEDDEKDPEETPAKADEKGSKEVPAKDDAEKDPKADDKASKETPADDNAEKDPKEKPADDADADATQKTFSATSAIFDDISAPCPAFRKHVESQKLFAQGVATKKTVSNPYLTTPID